MRIILSSHPFGTKCGCPDCKLSSIPHTRREWKSRSNKDGKPYGNHRKGTHGRHGLK